MNAVLDSLDFDPDALRARYRAERDRRLRADGNEQYVEMAADFAHYIDDPYVDPGFTRAPLTDSVDVVVVGGGFGGLIAAARLREAGVQDIRIIEKGGDFGGTWYWNRYPGAQCDIEAYIYLPLLEETNFVPKEKYSYAKEIREHATRIGEHYDLYSKACFQTEIREIRWLEDENRWLITTNRDDAMKARYVVMSSGPLNRPKLPGLPGIGDFKGHSFHTSRWDYAYTGGSSEGGLTNLADKRVAIIGTGATAIQCVPHLGLHAKQLYVFQRTPSSVDLRGNRPTDPAWVKTLTPGWQKRRMRNFNTLVSGLPQDEDLVQDGWTDIIRNLGAGVAARLAAGDANALDPQELARQMELSDFRKMNQIRARVDAVVQDPATAEALKPWYRQFCKRPTFNDDYLPTFNRPNVTLVDTLGRGVDRVTEKGLVFDGVEYEVDCIIFATGFEVGTAYTRRAGFEIVGRGGRKLSDHWSDGMRTLHGLSAAGFPNCFHLGITQNTLTPNFPHMLDEQAAHVAHVVRETDLRQAQVVEVTAEGEAGWLQTIRDTALNNLAFRQDCTPGYYNGEGHAGEGKGLFDNLYGPGSDAFFALAKQWRDEGELKGLEMR
ncbi:MAG: NAD(P)/FAD-dependent oxidoreductase [Phenylobacterium sp.]|uniref:flavin-containing monooxygenase n=1 Tax=Phenylobacterium sp. TaxID=1871053 RepID=UPI001A634203|nr:NAD(P)/FAD-dependent oxidoreductase [Phenylobacterium sp.]MBL8557017.1 NAD(P)/FAD-dependent oxidoreductase [Phenylobacterium sp.]